MFSNLGTKLALKKMGLPSNSLDFSKIPSPFASTEAAPAKKGAQQVPAKDGAAQPWMSVKKLPLTVQAWLTPPAPAVAVAEPPKPGDLAPIDRDRQLQLGKGRETLVVFLRCVGCAFAQKTFLALRHLSTRHPDLTCIAVSHSSAAATKKWIDLQGGAWNVQLVTDEDRAIYAAWGLGLGSVWYVFNPTSQVAGFKEKGWQGANVANWLQRSSNQHVLEADQAREGPATVLGNKWQQAGAWAVDGRGTVVWGGKAARADDLMDLEAGVQALGLVGRRLRGPGR